MIPTGEYEIKAVHVTPEGNQERVLVGTFSKKDIQQGEAVKGQNIREGVFKLIKTEYPDFDENKFVSIDELSKYRRLYLTHLVEQEKGELALIDKDVMDAVRNNSILSENIQDEIEAKLTPGQKLADKIAEFGGSWAFIIVFFFIYSFLDDN